MEHCPIFPQNDRLHAVILSCRPAARATVRRVTIREILEMHNIPRERLHKPERAPNFLECAPLLNVNRHATVPHVSARFGRSCWFIEVGRAVIDTAREPTIDQPLLLRDSATRARHREPPMSGLHTIERASRVV